jgi:ribonuclease-3
MVGQFTGPDQSAPLEAAGNGGPRQMITPQPGPGRILGEQNPAYVLLSPPSLQPQPNLPHSRLTVTPERRRQLLALLAELGLDPLENPGPGDSAQALAPLEEALSHTSARLPINHERLEFLGDAVLRLAAAEYLEQHHGSLLVGQRSALRAQLVSDRWLAELGERCGLERLSRIGTMAASDQAGRATIQAELCEALIGAIYLAWGGPQGGLLAVARWLTPHWQRSSQELLSDPDRHNWKSALQEWSQARGLGLPTYHCHQASSGHGDPRRFHCTASLPRAQASPMASGSADQHTTSEGWGPSRRAAEQAAAARLLQLLRSAPAG